MDAPGLEDLSNQNEFHFSETSTGLPDLYRKLTHVSAFDTTESLGSIRTRLDAELDNLARIMQFLRTRRNALALVSRLPPELLARVFLEYAENDTEFHSYKVTHVCRHWREVALGSPRLWTRIDVHKPKWASELLFRSKNAALHVEVAGQISSLVSGSLQLVMQNMSRIGHLSLGLEYSTFKDVRSKLELPAPFLESLELIQHPGPYAGSFMPYIGTRFDLSSCDLFGGQSPRLRSVKLDRVLVGWQSGLFTNLIHLEIRGIADSQRPSVEVFRGLLERSSGVRTLTLCDALPHCPGEAITGGMERVILSNLQKLTIQDSVHKCTRLTELISIPSTTMLSYVCHQVHAVSPESIADIFPPALPKILRPQIVWLDDACFDVQLRVWTSGPVTDSPYVQVALRWALVSEHSKAESKLLIVAALCGICDPTYVQGLRVVDLQVPHQVWTGTMSAFKAVRSLSLQGSPADTFINSLWTSSLGDGLTFFPHLQELTFEFTTFSMSTCLSPSEVNELDLFEKLRDSLMARSAHGTVIERLSIIESFGIFKDGVDMLKELVIHVEWDGVEQEVDDDDDEEDEDDEDDEESEEYTDDDYYDHDNDMDGTDEDTSDWA